MPIQCEYYALEGLSQLMTTVRQVKRLYNAPLELEGVLLTMYDGRLNLTQQVVAEVKKFFPEGVCHGHPPQRTALGGAQLRQAHQLLRPRLRELRHTTRWRGAYRNAIRAEIGRDEGSPPLSEAGGGVGYGRIKEASE